MRLADSPQTMQMAWSLSTRSACAISAGATIFANSLGQTVLKANARKVRSIGRGDVMALDSYNAPEFAVAFHGAAWLGGTVTTVNPAYTPEEIGKQLKDSGACCIACPSP